jgi:hypothetical protein
VYKRQETIKGDIVGEKSAFSSNTLNISVNLAMILSPIQMIIPARTSFGTKKIVFSIAIFRYSCNLSMMIKNV